MQLPISSVYGAPAGEVLYVMSAILKRKVTMTIQKRAIRENLESVEDCITVDVKE